MAKHSAHLKILFVRRALICVSNFAIVVEFRSRGKDLLQAVRESKKDLDARFIRAFSGAMPCLRIKSRVASDLKSFFASYKFRAASV